MGELFFKRICAALMWLSFNNFPSARSALTSNALEQSHAICFLEGVALLERGQAASFSRQAGF